MAHRAVRGGIEALSRLSGSENAARPALEAQSNHLLAEAKSEVLKQECRADFLDCSIREFQKQFNSSRMETDHAKLGCETSRREQARLHEELAQRERALRETRIGSIHEMGEVKRAQEMRVEDFSWLTFQELTSQMKQLQERANLMNDFGEFQDVESICSQQKSSHVPSQPVVVPSPCGMLSRDQSLRPDSWNLLGTSGNVFGSPLAPID